ncbi:hypothetical protein Tco_0935068 [Tanacetum coccineum]
MDSCLVSIKGVRYQVRVREFANWYESQEEGEINDKKKSPMGERNERASRSKSVDSFEEGEIIGESAMMEWSRLNGKENWTMM